MDSDSIEAAATFFAICCGMWILFNLIARVRFGKPDLFGHRD